MLLAQPSPPRARPAGHCCLQSAIPWFAKLKAVYKTTYKVTYSLQRPPQDEKAPDRSQVAPGLVLARPQALEGQALLSEALAVNRLSEC